MIFYKPFNTDVSVYILIDTFLHISFYGNDEDEENFVKQSRLFSLDDQFLFSHNFYV